jgi:tetratricopeptide (TPR) repeat protein
MAEEKSRKDLLEEPDPFMVFVGKAMTLVKTYQQQIVMAVIAVVLVALVISGVVYFRQKSEDRAAAMFGKAIAKYQGIMQNTPGFAALEEVKGDFKAIIDQYGSTGAGRSALIKYGNVCFEMKQYDEAIDSYEKALTAFKGQNDFAGLINTGLAYAYEAKGDVEAAEKYFNRVLSDPNAVAKDHALFNLARIYEKQGRAEQRDDILKRLVTEYPESIFYQPAKEKMFVPVAAAPKTGAIQVPVQTVPEKAPESLISEPPEAPVSVEAEMPEIMELPGTETTTDDDAEDAALPVIDEGAVAPEPEVPENP